MKKIKIIKKLFCISKTKGELVFICKKDRACPIIIKCFRSLLKPTYIKGSRFGAEILEALYNDSLSKYLQEYSSPKLLLLDEVEYFDGKEATKQVVRKLLKQRLHYNKTTVIVSGLKFEHFSDLFGKELLDYLTIYN